MNFTTFFESVLRMRFASAAWRVLCRVAFDGVAPSQLEGAERALALTLFGNVAEVSRDARSRRVLILGRGAGKTTIAAAWALHRMLTADLSMCGPGSLPTVVTIAPGARTARLAVRTADELARQSPAIRKYLGTANKHGFTLRRKDGRRVAFAAYPASRGGAAARGIDIIEAILDESWFFTSSADFVVTDRDNVRALVPRLIPGGGVNFLSTPWPAETLTGELFDANFGTPTTALAALGGTLLMRDADPAIAEMIARERAIDPENAEREFDCAIGATGSGTFFDQAAIKHAVDPLMFLPATTLPGATLSAGADLALIRDSATLAISAREGNRVRVVELQELKPKRGEPLKLSHVVGTFAAALNARGLPWVYADGYNREGAREYAVAAGIQIHAAPEGRSGKVSTYVETRRLMNEGLLDLPDHPRLLAQLRSVVSKPAEGGGLIISSPRRLGQGHGDLVSAMVLSIFPLGHISEPCSLIRVQRRRAI